MTTTIGGIVAPLNGESIIFTSMAGAAPERKSEGCYINNPAAQIMTNILLPAGVTDSKIVLLGANGNTTIFHGLGFLLKGAVNVVLPTNGIIAFVKFSAHNTAWIEQYRSF